MAGRLVNNVQQNQHVDLIDGMEIDYEAMNNDPNLLVMAQQAHAAALARQRERVEFLLRGQERREREDAIRQAERDRVAAIAQNQAQRDNNEQQVNKKYLKYKSKYLSLKNYINNKLN